MKNPFYYFLILITFGFMLQSCGTSRKAKKNHTTTYSAKAVKGDARVVLKQANKFIGTQYKYGGADKKGMDCSGLVWVSFNKAGLEIPRISHEQAEFGKQIKLSKVRPGDVLFFNTSGNKISHVGIVDHIKNNEIFFIHSSSSKGVIISSLENTYWKKRFVKAQRFLKN